MPRQANRARPPTPETGLVVVPPGILEVWQLVLIDTSKDALLGFMALEEPGVCGPDTAVVVGSGAVTGWGPALYDSAMEFVGERGWWLAPDRRSISPNARPVWAFYDHKRSDVESMPLPRKLDCGRYGDPVLDRMFRFGSAKQEGPLAPRRARTLARMISVGDSFVEQQAKDRETTPKRERRRIASKALDHFSAIYRSLVESGMPRERAYSLMDVAFLSGMAMFLGAAVPALLANPARTVALKRRLMHA